jgi:enoyl-[acyl-carrier protein] reductase I
MTTGSSKKVALIMGIANQRSIAWSCLETFLQKDWLVIYTVQNDKIKSKVERILVEQNVHERYRSNCVLGGFSCDVTDSWSMERFFREALPETLQQQQHLPQVSLHAVIHSLAFASNLKTPLIDTTRESFRQAHEISSYSLIEIARESLPYLQVPECRDNNDNDIFHSSITTLSYLGAVRAIPGYNVMGPAKASLEGIVRGLARELGSGNYPVRVNAVRAGPLPTISSKGGIAGFDLMRQDVQLNAPLGNVTTRQVANSIYHVAAEAQGMTGQTIDVDGGYSIVAGPVPEGLPSGA